MLNGVVATQTGVTRNEDGNCIKVSRRGVLSVSSKVFIAGEVEEDAERRAQVAQEVLLPLIRSNVPESKLSMGFILSMILLSQGARSVQEAIESVERCIDHVTVGSGKDPKHLYMPVLHYNTR